MPLCMSLMRTSRDHSPITRPVIFNQRGCRATPLSTPQLAPICDTSDLRQVFQYLHAQHPRATLVVIGFSTGASLVISYLGEFGHSALVKSGVAVCPVWDHQLSVKQLSWSLRTWWSWKVKRWYLSLSAPFQCCRQPLDVLLTCDLDRMEEKIFAPFSEHANVTEYWQGNSPIRDVDDIAVPLLVIHYQDDPLVPSSTVPSELFSLYPHLLLLTCPVGGHCGLLQRLQTSATVAEEVATEFIRQILVLIDPPAMAAQPQAVSQQQQRKATDRYRNRRRVESLTLLRRSRNPFTSFQIRSSC